MTPEGQQFGTIDVRRRGGEIVYRARLGEEVLGYANSLKLAAHRTYMTHLQRGANRNRPPNGLAG
ncbi:hypothetical protein ACFXP7_12170 [Microbacterium sp. P06]|uniref:hypothetical protein n=1 Tax=Microbacterium sp. P06 TaxID=3366949 RepID=UPI0037451AA5